MIGEKVRITKIDEPDDGYGKFTYLEKYKYPYKGFPNETIVNANAIFKRAIIGNVKLCKSLIRNPFRIYHRLTIWFAELSEVAFLNTKYIEDDKRFCRFCREILRVGMLMISDLRKRGKMEEWRYPQAVKGLVMFFEFDNAYRYPAQDVLSELDKENLKLHPRREIIRLVKIGLSRTTAVIPKLFKETSGYEFFDLGDKWKLLLWGLTIGLFVSPKLLRFVKNFLLELNIDEVKFDEGDWYWVCEREDHNYRDIPYEQRLAERKAIDEEYFKTLPPPQGEKPYAYLVMNEGFFQMERSQAETLIRDLEKRVWDDWDKKHIVL